MRLPALTIAAIVVAAQVASAADWATSPSFYTHDWSTGHRVAQYAPIGPFYYFTRPDYLKSGYRQYRSTLDLGNSSDNMHIVEEWGAQVVPYEQWRFPYRPYSVPYNAWGPPYGGLGGGTGGYPYSGGQGANLFGGLFPPFGYGGFGPGGYGAGGFGAGGAAPFAAASGGPGGPGGPGHGGPGHGGPHHGGGFPGHFPGRFFPQAPNYAQPWLDGHYPAYDLNDRSRYWEPYGRGW
jgi:hypothetical protein